MTEKKQFHLKIKWKNREKTEAHEIVLYDGGQPLCELISVDDARLVRDIMNGQDAEIKRLKKENRGLQFKIIDMLDFVKEKGTVTREEIKKWWNGDVDD